MTTSQQLRVIKPSVLLFVLWALVGLPCLAQKPGTSTRTLSSSGDERTYILHIPRGYSPKQKKLLPMVLMLHGRGGNAKGASSAYYGSWKSLADKEKFIAVFPEALGRPRAWRSWGGSRSKDSKFLAELIDTLLKELRIDKNRVFMTGHSSGGYMSFAFAAAHSEKVAAIGPVAGLYGGIAAPKVPVSVISIHGIDDNVVGYESRGESSARHSGRRGAVECAAFFARAAGCKKEKRKDMQRGRVHVDTWSKGRNKTEVQLYSLVGWGHGWPRKSSRTVAATELIWEFFKKHPRPAESVKKTAVKSPQKQDG